jgi:hypothetical protein
MTRLDRVKSNVIDGRRQNLGHEMSSRRILLHFRRYDRRRSVGTWISPANEQNDCRQKNGEADSRDDDPDGFISHHADRSGRKSGCFDSYTLVWEALRRLDRAFPANAIAN